LFGKQHPLAHPNKGLTQRTILHYVRDQTDPMKLTIVVQDVVDYKILWFPKMQYGVEDVLQVRKDLLGLLGFELELQNPVVEKIWEFTARIAHKAILNIRNLGLSK